MNNTSLGTPDLLHVYGKPDIELKSQLGDDAKLKFLFMRQGPRCL